MTIDHVGAKWYKCDFHVHSVASRCFLDKSVTAQDWVKAAIAKGLDCVAVTDHNTGDGIDAIVEAAKGTGLTVFPGVEITCSDAKVHLLVLFDLDTTSVKVNDFLISCKINRTNFATEEAHSPLGILDVVAEANKRGGIVIPAHIDDEHVGFTRVAPQIQQDVFRHPDIRAVQTKYSPEIWKEKSFTKPAVIASECNKVFLTFSDNPDDVGSSKHGMDGIGARYTWIKMGAKPSLEGLRLALIQPDIRIKNDLENTECPARTRKQWIKSIKIDGTSITDPNNPLIIEFNPQLNAIIGGRGSGKSSILRFLRGIFNKTTDLEGIDSLTEILKDHQDFYQTKTKEKGVFQPDYKKEQVIVECMKDDDLFRISASVVEKKITTKIEQYNEQTKSWTEIKETTYLKLFDFKFFSQKQIYEMAGNTSSLKTLIDDYDASMKDLKDKADAIRTAHENLASDIAKIEKNLKGEEDTLVEKKQNEDRISKFEKNNCGAVKIQFDKFSKQEQLIQLYKSNIGKIYNLFDKLISDFNFVEINANDFGEEHGDEIRDISAVFVAGTASLKKDLIELKRKSDALLEKYSTDVAKSSWEQHRQAIVNESQRNDEELKSSGVDLADIKKWRDTRDTIKKQLDSYKNDKISLEEKKEAIKETQKQYVVAIDNITQKRRNATKQLTNNTSVAITIQAFGDCDDFEQQLRKILGLETNTGATYANDMATVVEYYQKQLSKNPNKAMQVTIDALEAIASNHGSPPIKLGKLTTDKLTGLDVEKQYKLKLLLPDDKIIVKYKAHDKGDFKLLSAASPGQKTAAILSVILSQCDSPLLLDQPEDDLDNKIIFDLIVQGILEGKQHRQMIIVTHNANIPVNGDAEYIISMNSESKKISVLHCGTLEDKVVKKEVCTVMEGSEKAFRRRADKYGLD